MRMNGWIDGWMDGWMDAWINGWKNLCFSDTTTLYQFRTHTESVDVKSRGDITLPDIFCWTI